ncbi:MAG: hypothetical protein R6V53_02415 [Candidatus Woesearchaeota archaeon]
MSNHVKQRDYKRGGSRHTKLSRYRKTRPKSFKTKEAAEAWAKQQGLKDYKLVDLHENQNTSKIIVEAFK